MRTVSKKKTVRKPATRKGKGSVRNRSANSRTGSPLESLLRKKGLYADATAKAIKETVAWQIEDAMTKQGITKVEMAEAMGTSRSALDRLLDPQNPSVTLATLFRAASVLGVELRIELVPPT